MKDRVSTHAPARGRRGGLELGVGVRRGVSTHAPARGRPGARTPGSTRRHAFQLTPPRGGDAGVGFRASVCVLVSTHAPARGRRGQILVIRSRCSCFNSRPREGATLCGSSTPLRSWFQLTPPRGGDRVSRGLRSGGEKVSTHAPARGRLIRGPGRRIRHSVSTHAPARGRPARGPARYTTPPVSTHAPARGRRDLADARSWACLFQLTPPRGGDCIG